VCDVICKFCCTISNPSQTARRKFQTAQLHKMRTTVIISIQITPCILVGVFPANHVAGNHTTTKITYNNQNITKNPNNESQKTPTLLPGTKIGQQTDLAKSNIKIAAP